MFQICHPQRTPNTCSHRAQRPARVPRHTGPDDRIPDRIPGVGYLDDAIMAEFAARELTHEIAAYEAFRENREHLPKTDEPARPEARHDALQARTPPCSRTWCRGLCGMTAPVADCWTTIGEAAARVVARLFCGIARRGLRSTAGTH